MAAVPVQPVTVTLAELTAIKTSLTDDARRFRDQAVRSRGLPGFTTRAALLERARLREDLAARLSFAVPGEPITVIETTEDQ